MSVLQRLSLPNPSYGNMVSNLHVIKKPGSSFGKLTIKCTRTHSPKCEHCKEVAIIALSFVTSPLSSSTYLSPSLPLALPTEIKYFLQASPPSSCSNVVKLWLNHFCWLDLAHRRHQRQHKTPPSIHFFSVVPTLHAPMSPQNRRR